MTRLPGAILLAVLAGYRRWISPLFGPHCRFHPSCSAYAMSAIGEYGAARGGWLALRRLARCQPFSRGGYDPVPARLDARAPLDDGLLAGSTHVRGAQS
jgi:putative membrane protein insertion efficiency factor